MASQDQSQPVDAAIDSMLLKSISSVALPSTDYIYIAQKQLEYWNSVDATANGGFAFKLTFNISYVLDINLTLWHRYAGRLRASASSRHPRQQELPCKAATFSRSSSSHCRLRCRVRGPRPFPSAVSSFIGSMRSPLPFRTRIGRISKNFLTKINKSVVVDIVEPVKKFTDQITEGSEFEEEREAGKIGQVFNVGLEQWEPEKGAYWIIWT